ncbi:MAG: outer membrane protein assembly factor BamD [Blastocatellia bacterium]|nr:outer membrane protein assembly factor BamD [Blastocatellia bacterium]
MKLAKRLSLLILAIIILTSGACGGGGKKKLSAADLSDEPKDGRDRELFQEALGEMKKKRYEQGRLLINTLVTTYGDSPFLPMAKLTIADSYYREGGTSNLIQAEAEYKDWLQFFPNHELAPQVLLKMAEIHMRQVQTADRDKEHAFLAEKQLLEIRRRFPQAAQNEQVEEYLQVVQELLAEHDLRVAKFYFERRENWKATESRCIDIVNKYPNYTSLDTALWYLARSQEQEENTEDASKNYARIVREFPKSKYRDAAAERLERFGKPVPDPMQDVEERIVERRSMMARMMENLFGPSLAVSKEGILLKKDDQVDEATYRLINEASQNSFPSPQSTRGASEAKDSAKSAEATSSSTDTNDSSKPGSASRPRIKEKKEKKEKSK